MKYFSIKKTTYVFSIATTLLTTLLLGLGVSQARDKRAALPSKVLSARTIYVDNQTNDAEIQYDAYLGLSKWGRYEIVDAPQKADLVLRFTGSSTVKFVPAGDANDKYDPKLVKENSSAGEELAPPGCTRITLIEPKSGNALWGETRKTNNAQEKSKLLDGLHDAVDQQEKSHNK
jgi:hypothetical protein